MQLTETQNTNLSKIQNLILKKIQISEHFRLLTFQSGRLSCEVHTNIPRSESSSIWNTSGPEHFREVTLSFQTRT